VDRDLVVWLVFGAHHLPRPEDWPLMPAEKVSCMIKPFGFFDASPVLDLAPATRRQVGQTHTQAACRGKWTCVVLCCVACCLTALACSHLHHQVVFSSSNNEPGISALPPPEGQSASQL
jgi:hypothetical protein